jgi:predicted transcriptional regulator
VNKNLLVVIPYFALVLAGLIMLGLIAIFAPEQLDKSAQQTTTLLGIASAAVVTFYMLGKQNATLEEVKTQTNGTNTALRKQNEELHAQVLELTKAVTPSSN